MVSRIPSFALTVDSLTFKREKDLGVGASSQTFKYALENDPSVKVVLKVPTTDIDEGQWMAYYTTECKALVALNQKETPGWQLSGPSLKARLDETRRTSGKRRIVQLLADRINDEPWLMLEFAPDAIDEIGDMTELDIVEAMYQTVSAIKFAHDLHICLYDFEPPAKISRVRWDRQSRTIKVIDWNATGDLPYFFERDLLFFGRMMYTLLTGDILPVAEGDTPDKKNHHTSGSIGTSNPRWNKLNAGTQDIIRSLLARDAAYPLRTPTEAQSALAWQLAMLTSARNGDTRQLLDMLTDAQHGGHHAQTLAIAGALAPLNAQLKSDERSKVASAQQYAQQAQDNDLERPIRSMRGELNAGIYDLAYIDLKEFVEGLEKQGQLYRRASYEMLRAQIGDDLQKANVEPFQLSRDIKLLEGATRALSDDWRGQDALNVLRTYRGETTASLEVLRRDAAAADQFAALLARLQDPIYKRRDLVDAAWVEGETKRLEQFRADILPELDAVCQNAYLQDIAEPKRQAIEARLQAEVEELNKVRYFMLYYTSPDEAKARQASLNRKEVETSSKQRGDPLHFDDILLRRQNREAEKNRIEKAFDEGKYEDAVKEAENSISSDKRMVQQSDEGWQETDVLRQTAQKGIAQTARVEALMTRIDDALNRLPAKVDPANIQALTRLFDEFDRIAGLFKEIDDKINGNDRILLERTEGKHIQFRLNSALQERLSSLTRRLIDRWDGDVEAILRLVGDVSIQGDEDALNMVLAALGSTRSRPNAPSGVDDKAVVRARRRAEELRRLRQDAQRTPGNPKKQLTLLNDYRSRLDDLFSDLPTPWHDLIEALDAMRIEAERITPRDIDPAILNRPLKLDLIPGFDGLPEHLRAKAVANLQDSAKNADSVEHKRDLYRKFKELTGETLPELEALDQRDQRLDELQHQLETLDGDLYALLDTVSSPSAFDNRIERAFLDAQTIGKSLKETLPDVPDNDSQMNDLVSQIAQRIETIRGLHDMWDVASGTGTDVDQLTQAHSRMTKVQKPLMGRDDIRPAVEAIQARMQDRMRQAARALERADDKESLDDALELYRTAGLSESADAEQRVQARARERVRQAALQKVITFFDNPNEPPPGAISKVFKTYYTEIGQPLPTEPEYAICEWLKIAANKEQKVAEAPASDVGKELTNLSNQYAEQADEPAPDWLRSRLDRLNGQITQAAKALIDKTVARAEDALPDVRKSGAPDSTPESRKAMIDLYGLNELNQDDLCPEIGQLLNVARPDITNLISQIEEAIDRLIRHDSFEALRTLKVDLALAFVKQAMAWRKLSAGQPSSAKRPLDLAAFDSGVQGLNRAQPPESVKPETLPSSLDHLQRLVAGACQPYEKYLDLDFRGSPLGNFRDYVEALRAAQDANRLEPFPDKNSVDPDWFDRWLKKPCDALGVQRAEYIDTVMLPKLHEEARNSPDPSHVLEVLKKIDKVLESDFTYDKTRARDTAQRSWIYEQAVMNADIGTFLPANDRQASFEDLLIRLFDENEDYAAGNWSWLKEKLESDSAYKDLFVRKLKNPRAKKLVAPYVEQAAPTPFPKQEPDHEIMRSAAQDTKGDGKEKAGQPTPRPRRSRVPIFVLGALILVALVVGGFSILTLIQGNTPTAVAVVPTTDNKATVETGFAATMAVVRTSTAVQQQTVAAVQEVTRNAESTNRAATNAQAAVNLNQTGTVIANQKDMNALTATALHLAQLAHDQTATAQYTPPTQPPTPTHTPLPPTFTPTLTATPIMPTATATPTLSPSPEPPTPTLGTITPTKPLMKNQKTATAVVSAALSGNTPKVAKFKVGTWVQLATTAYVTPDQVYEDPDTGARVAANQISYAQGGTNKNLGWAYVLQSPLLMPSHTNRYGYTVDNLTFWYLALYVKPTGTDGVGWISEDSILGPLETTPPPVDPTRLSNSDLAFTVGKGVPADEPAIGEQFAPLMFLRAAPALTSPLLPTVTVQVVQSQLRVKALTITKKFLDAQAITWYLLADPDTKQILGWAPAK